MHAVRIVLFALCCAATLFNEAWPESLPALHVIARLLAGHDHHARVWLHKPARETS